MRRCTLTESIVAILVEEADSKRPLETGGVLLGSTGESGLVIEQVVGPGPLARHERFQFLPDHEFQEAEIARVYEESGRTIEYLGDWHTHPDGGCSLSTTDKATLKTIARHKSARQPRPVMMLLAGGNPWQMAVWQWTKRSRLFRGSARRIMIERSELLNSAPL
jgi:integrative and conjugative element protein (TIGR02256 family)